MQTPPSPPRLKSTDLPEDSDVDGRHTGEPDPFLSGYQYPILPEDMDMTDLPPAQLYERNQTFLEESMKSDRPLVSPPEETAVLRDEYSDSPKFLAEINSLIDQGYRIIIRVKGDGDCFYRAMAFAYLDSLIRSPGRNKVDRLAATKCILQNAGFDASVYEEPFEILQSLVEPHQSDHTSVKETLLQGFMDPSTSNYIVMYMRLLTSAQTRIDPQFAEFLWDIEPQMEQVQLSVDGFCRRSVEPLGKEADHPQVVALAQALNVHLKVAYLDGHADSHVRFVDIPGESGGAEPLVLLYRPGHYDILQRSADS